VKNTVVRSSYRAGQRRQAFATAALLTTLVLGTASVQAQERLPVSASPAVVTMPNGRLAHFFVSDSFDVYPRRPGLAASVGRFPVSTSNANPNWSRPQGLRVQGDENGLAPLPPCTIQQPGGTISVFVASYDRKNILTLSYRLNASTNTLERNIREIGTLTFGGPFDNFSIFPLPDKSGAAGLVYTQRGRLFYQRLKLHQYRLFNQTWNEWRMQYPSSVLLGSRTMLTFGSISGAMVINQNATEQIADQPWKLVVASGVHNGALILRSWAASATGEIAQPTLFQSKSMSSLRIRTDRDILTHVAPDGRAVVSCLTTSNQAAHVVQTTPQNGDWIMDTSYPVGFSVLPYSHTPVTTYFARTTDVRNVGGSLILNEGARAIPVQRFLVGPSPSNLPYHLLMQYGFARRLPKASIRANQTKKLLVGIVEGPPPVPWQNINLQPSNSSMARAIIEAVQSNVNRAQGEIKVGAVFQMDARAKIGPAVKLDMEVGYQHLYSNETSVTTIQRFEASFQLPAQPQYNLPADLPHYGWAIFAGMGLNVYEYEVLDNNMEKIPGATIAVQVVPKGLHMTAMPYALHPNGVRPGHLYTYAGRDQVLDYLPQYVLSPLGGNAPSVGGWAQSVWSAGLTIGDSISVANETMRANGFYFDIQALVGFNAEYEAGAVSALAGVHATGNWLWSATQGARFTLASQVEALPYNLNQRNTFRSYTYRTYWLKEDANFVTDLKSNLFWQNMNEMDRSMNQSVFDMICEGSAPWKLTYSVTDWDFNGSDLNLRDNKSQDNRRR
jgi:hypothetical protein